jgi:hypothetical protein
VAPAFAAGFNVSGALCGKPEGEPDEGEGGPGDVNPFGRAEGGGVEVGEMGHECGVFYSELGAGRDPSADASASG